ncbi:hypothetical protein GDO81_011412 [Engystomops pustulosus]|uniref:Uncharacterized protein n=1 Tax=Engystomops pustulosus TaxID=76066 RepID=A0AAV7BDU7_ENGPU|nr:hypothetical protein GDO81_011412 [Engystomops pustulosus]
MFPQTGKGFPNHWHVNLLQLVCYRTHSTLLDWSECLMQCSTEAQNIAILAWHIHQGTSSYTPCTICK